MQNKKNDVLVRGLSDKTLNELNSIMKKRGYSTRNEMLCKIIEDYVVINSDEIANYLPEIVGSMCRMEIKNAMGKSDEIITDVYKTLLRLIRITQKFENFLYPEIDKFENFDLNSKQLLAIIEAAEEEERKSEGENW
jgi:hypothetical protein